MSWIRLDDRYIYHPKFAALSPWAFRLWHEGMAYCRTMLTDGLIPHAALKLFHYATPRSVGELTASLTPSSSPLWESVEGVGYRVHDYLDWNRSRDKELEDRELAKARAVKSRSGVRRTSRVTCDARSVQEKVLGSFPEKGCGEKPTDEVLGERAGRLREELYPAWYAKYRHGARLRLVANSLEFADALSLVRLWDDARLEKLARIVLTTDDEWIAGTDRNFRIFALKASWAENRLCEVERRARATES
jgi:hypothetical protein